MTTHVIPPITNLAGKYWQQPPRDEILVDETHALMTQTTLDQLHDCSGSRPTAVYAGKMWRSRWQGHWWLWWYGTETNKQSSVERRPIILT